MSTPQPFDSNPASKLHFTEIADGKPPAVHARYSRGLLWVVLALICAAVLWYVGYGEYVQRWAGGLFKAASGGWIGFRFSKVFGRIDPSATPDGTERGLMHIARALLIIGLAVAVCVAV